MCISAAADPFRSYISEMKWQNPISFLALAGATLLLAMFPFAPSRSWACSASSGSSFSHATQSDESSLTICAKSTTVSKSKTPAKPAPAKPAPPKPVVSKPVVSKPVVSKPVVSKPVVSKPAPPKPVLPKVTSKPAPKPAPPKQVQAAPKPSPKPTVKTTQSTTILTAEARFSPAAAPISASNLSPALGELVEFRALAATHFKTASILGRLAEVKFTPIAIDWNFGDGTSASGEVIHHGFSRSQTLVVSARVTYSSEYRFSGENAWLSAGSISVTDRVVIVVAGEASSGEPINQSGQVVLVAANCIERPKSFGCQG